MSAAPPPASGASRFSCGFLRGDLFRLPFADGSLAGVWNLGVMERFERADGIAILREIGRALAPGGTALLFRPPESAPRGS